MKRCGLLPVSAVALLGMAAVMALPGAMRALEAPLAPASLVSPCSGTITPALSADTIRMCDSVTVPSRPAPSCPVCPGGANVVFVVPGAIPVESTWLSGEAGDALRQLKEYQTAGGPIIQVAVVDLGTGNRARWSKTLLDLTEKLDRAAPLFMNRGQFGWAYGADAKEPIQVLKRGRDKSPTAKPCEYIIMFAVSCNRPGDTGCEFAQQTLRTAAATIHGEGITLMVACPGRRPDFTFLECRGYEPQMTSADLYTQYPQRGKLGSMVNRLFAEATGQQPLKEQTLTEFLPAGLTYVPGSASEPPTDVSVAPEQTTRRWNWQLASASDAHTVTFRAAPLQEGPWPIGGMLEIVDPRNLHRQVPMQPVTVTVAGLCETPTPPATPTATPPPTRTASATAIRVTAATPTPTPVPSATPTRVPLPVYLPVLLREDCKPPAHRLDVALVIDASTSMLKPTSAGRSKLDAARDAAGIFLGQLHLDAGDQAAIVAFNSDAVLLHPLTADRTTLDAALARIQPAVQTCLVCGVYAGANELASPRGRAANRPV